MARTFEVNFDGLVGPTHNYAGLSHGNVASMSHRGAVSHPRAAALEGLAKMKLLADLGVPQAVLPPHPRPDVATLRAFGFQGSDAAVLAAAARQAPELLHACGSSSHMWVANAATVAPGRDTADGRLHLTPANLGAKLHRSLEPPQTARLLRAIFADPRRFTVHPPVPFAQGLGDEGAANHTRLAGSHAGDGVHFFVYGHHALRPPPGAQPRRFPSRQAWEASAAVARAHRLDPARVVFARQHPVATDAGVFHNDVISVGNENVLLYHERAFVGTESVLAELRRAFRRAAPGSELHLVRVAARDVSLPEAVRSYLFNSQLVTLAPGRMALIAPRESAETPRVRRWLERLVAQGETPIQQVHHVDLRQSMRNGGGPACLRLRVVLTEAEWAAIPPGVRLTSDTYERLTAWVRRHYREKLEPRDLADPQLLQESRRALDELSGLLGLGDVYPFQDA